MSRGPGPPLPQPMEEEKPLPPPPLYSELQQGIPYNKSPRDTTRDQSRSPRGLTASEIDQNIQANPFDHVANDLAKLDQQNYRTTSSPSRAPGVSPRVSARQLGYSPRNSGGYGTPKGSGSEPQQSYRSPIQSARLAEVLLSEREAPPSYRETYGVAPYVEPSAAFDVNDVFSFARNGQRKQVENFLSRGFNADTQDEHGNALFHVACQNGNKPMAKLAIKYGGDMDRQNLKGNTGLHFLYAFKYEEIAGYFEEKGANRNIKNVKGKYCHEGLE